MTGTLPIVLIVVVWLFVLAPIALRGRKPIRHTNEAFEETRVIHAGGEDIQPRRRRPRLSPAVVHSSSAQDDLETVEADDILLEDEPGTGGSRLSAKFGNAFGKFGRSHNGTDKVQAMEVVDGSVVAELPAPTAQPDPADTELADDDVALFDDEQTDSYPYDDAYLSPADFLHEDAHYEVAEEYLDTEEDADSEFGGEPELSEEDLEFAAKRRGRGGYDPEADAEATASRFQRRQRTLLGLVAGVVIGIIAAAILGGAWWFLPAAIAVLTVAYLYVLRQQVQQEKALRARRIRHMRRARLGVRSAEGTELGLPSRLRRPGAVVLELDDDSADFSDLPMVTAHFEPELDDHHASEPRRVS